MYVYEVKKFDAEKCTVLAWYVHNLNTDNKRLILVNAQFQSWRKEFDQVCFQRHIKMVISIMT